MTISTEISTLRELILARTYFGEFGGLAEFSFQLRLAMWPSAKLSSLNVIALHAFLVLI